MKDSGNRCVDCGRAENATAVSAWEERVVGSVFTTRPFVAPTYAHIYLHPNVHTGTGAFWLVALFGHNA